MTPHEVPPAGPAGPLQRALRAVLDIRPGEAAAVAWGFLYIFALFSAYYVIRPIRDEMGTHIVRLTREQTGQNVDLDSLAWLFTATLVAMLALSPLYGALVRRYPRRVFITGAYGFFAANLLAFMALIAWTDAARGLWLPATFFVWTSVFNLFVVSVFWALMVDVFTSEQGKRLFGFLAAGASVGAIAGSGVIVGFARTVNPERMLLASVVLLGVAVFAVRRLSRLADALRRTPGARAEEESPIGGSVIAGITHTLRSPYLLAIGAHMLIYAVTSTFLYFQQVQIVADTFGADRGASRAFFGQIDLLVNVLTLVIQVFLTGRILGLLGVGLTLAALPVLTFLGFAALALVPTIGVLVALQVIRRVGNFALTRPTRELLYTVVPREDKYKAKSVIDTVVYRLGDQVGGWSYAGLAALGLGISGIAWVAVPLAALWLANSLWLGRRQERLAAEQATAEPARADAPALVTRPA